MSQFRLSISIPAPPLPASATSPSSLFPPKAFFQVFLSRFRRSSSITSINPHAFFECHACPSSYAFSIPRFHSRSAFLAKAICPRTLSQADS